MEKYKLGDYIYIFKNTRKLTLGKSILNLVVIINFILKKQKVTIYSLLRRTYNYANLYTLNVYYS